MVTSWEGFNIKAGQQGVNPAAKVLSKRVERGRSEEKGSAPKLAPKQVAGLKKHLCFEKKAGTKQE